MVYTHIHPLNNKKEICLSDRYLLGVSLPKYLCQLNVKIDIFGYKKLYIWLRWVVDWGSDRFEWALNMHSTVYLLLYTCSADIIHQIFWTLRQVCQLSDLLI